MKRIRAIIAGALACFLPVAWNSPADAAAPWTDDVARIAHRGNPSFDSARALPAPLINQVGDEPISTAADAPPPAPASTSAWSRCGACCDTACDCRCSRCDCRRWLQSDRAFDGFIEPITNPVYFEDPRSMTRLRLIFMNHMIPEDSILGGGDLQLYAAQLTVALNDRLAIIAKKDGYIELQADAIPNEEGKADLATGLKYVLIRNPENQFLLTGGALFEWSNGSRDVFQGNGDGVWTLFLSSGKEFGPCGSSHFVGTIGWNLPVDSDAESEILFYSIHLDRRIVGNLYILWELVGLEYLESGQRMPGVSVEGGDLINLGAGAVTGNHFVTTAFGVTYRFNAHVEAAAAYEFPISEREDLMDNRTTATLSFIY